MIDQNAIGNVNDHIANLNPLNGLSMSNLNVNESTNNINNVTSDNFNNLERDLED